MKYKSYDSLVAALENLGLTGQMMRPFQLVVSSQHGPVWPNRGNSFWLTLQNEVWYLSTWAPVAYRIPDDQDVLALCSACMNVGTSAMYVVPDEIAAKFSLKKMPNDEFDRMLPNVDEEDP